MEVRGAMIGSRPVTGCLVGGVLAALLVVSLQAQEPPPQQPPFAEWLEALRAEAIAAGISEATVTEALATVEAPEPEVVERDRSQPERVRTLDDYVRGWVSPRTVTTARRFAAQHASLLERVTATYGLPGPVMVAVWGLESNFGRFTGTDPTIGALATLAYDPRRSSLFRRELIEALRILDQGHVTLEEMKGSWAGAMGQPQFMPSSYLKHAVDFDEDGRADIWTSEADVFASMANYLRNAGWVEGERWGREVRVTRESLDRVDTDVPRRSSGCGAVRQLTVARPLDDWAAMGLRLAGGAPLPDSTMSASLLRSGNRHFLVYRNYLALLDYNCSNSYAVSVGLLSDQLW